LYADDADYLSPAPLHKRGVGGEVTKKIILQIKKQILFLHRKLSVAFLSADGLKNLLANSVFCCNLVYEIVRKFQKVQELEKTAEMRTLLILYFGSLLTTS